MTVKKLNRTSSQNLRNTEKEVMALKIYHLIFIVVLLASCTKTIEKHQSASILEMMVLILLFKLTETFTLRSSSSYFMAVLADRRVPTTLNISQINWKKNMPSCIWINEAREHRKEATINQVLPSNKTQKMCMPYHAS